MKEQIYKLIEENKNMIYKIAYKYKRYYNVEDMFQSGVLGLINAYKNYKKDANTKFSTYAYPYIFGEIINLIKSDRTIKISSDSLKLYKLFEKSKEYLTQKLSRIPSIQEVSEFMEMDTNLLEDTILSCEFTLSLDNEIAEDLKLSDVVYEDNRIDIENMIDLRNAMEKLNDLESSIIDYRYYKDYTQSETAKALGLTQVQVSRNEKQILNKMRSKICA